MLIYKDYGISTDELYEDLRISRITGLYIGTLDVDPITLFEEIEQSRYYGTALTILAPIAEWIFAGEDYNPDLNQIPHFVYYLFFLAGVIGLYFLGQNFFNKYIALVVAILFATQPLFFGHAWINPKDTPHMSMFIITVATGFSMADHWLRNPVGKDQHKDNRTNLSRDKRLFIGALAAFTLLLWGTSALRLLSDRIIEHAYLSGGDNLIGHLFQSLTTTGSLEGYQILASHKIIDFQRWAAFITPIPLITAFVLAQRNDRLGPWQVDVVLLGAAAAWGIAVSTRVITLAAGGIVGIYALLKLKKNAIMPLTIYTLTAGVVSFISWPFLWISGLKGITGGLVTFSNFTHWHSTVLFEGELFFPEDLPLRFIPKLMALQFTEPLVILAVAGFLLSLVIIWQKRTESVKLMLMIAWFALPLLYLMIARPVIYDNFRQFIFITPPLFILAGLCLEKITVQIKRPLLNALLSAALIFPGVAAIQQLHPYQYIYYNQFTGGVEGAFRQYELDYWSTALKDAMAFVNENVPDGSNIITWIDVTWTYFYAEQDYQIKHGFNVPVEDYPLYDYAIIPERRFSDLKELPDAPVIYATKVDNATLMVVKEIPKTDP
ncbi:MAG: hypothetical protein JW757_02770 [Anaerolineales bacterium]|nr:hypothetical protein [Anaerolineales bacterium]